jgi:hypothetical protein
LFLFISFLLSLSFFSVFLPLIHLFHFSPKVSWLW